MGYNYLYSYQTKRQEETHTHTHMTRRQPRRQHVDNVDTADKTKSSNYETKIDDDYAALMDADSSLSIHQSHLSNGLGVLPLWSKLRLWLSVSVIVILVFWWTFLMFLCYILKPFSYDLYHTCKLFGYGQVELLTISLIEYFPNTRVHLYGDKNAIRTDESAFIVLNHTGDCDGFALGMLAAFFGQNTAIRFFLKDVLKYVFPVGAVMKMANYVFLKRDFARDAKRINAAMQRFSTHNERVWLALFPEGTYVTPKRLDMLRRSRKYAESQGWPVLHNVMTPRITGFKVCMEGDLSKVGAIYDITTAYGGSYDPCLGFTFPPSYLHACAGTLKIQNATSTRPAAVRLREQLNDGEWPVHMHVRRVPVAQVIKDPQAWLLDSFQRKDRLLDHFSKNGVFPQKQQTLKTSTSTWIKRFFTAVVPVLVFATLVLNWFVSQFGDVLPIVSLIQYGTGGFLLLTGALVVFMVRQGGKKKTLQKAKKTK
jgi:1-acyl-sn-glycerol-3-phosphate acyltransferase